MIESQEGVEELLLANESLARHAKFYSDVFDTVQDMLFVLRHIKGQFIILKANPAVAKALSVSVDDLVGASLESFFRFTTKPLQYDLSQLAEDKNSGIDAELKNGSKWTPVLASWSFLNDGVEGLKVLSLSDISELRATHTDLVRAKEEAQAASRAKSEFLANMSHEIRTPLNAILGVTDILMATPLSEEQREFIQLFKRSGETLLELISDVLDISKIEARKVEIHTEVYNFKDMISGVDSLLKLKALEKGIDLKFILSPEIAEFQLGDVQKLRQVLFNLVGNAVKFTNYGEVVVRICVHPDEKDMLHIVIRDTGIGISLKNQNNLFKHFVQADSSITRNFGGTGLGLAISKNFVQIFGGEIGFESEESRGAVFYFTWPYKPTLIPMTVSKDLTEAELIASFKKPIRLLLVDDTSSNRIIVKSYLKKLPIEVVEVESGEMAIEIFASSGPWDIVLMDIQMPEMDGNTATRHIRQLEINQGAQACPIVALTAQALREEKQASLDAGCNEHIAKPVSRKNLLSCLVRLTQN